MDVLEGGAVVVSHVSQHRDEHIESMRVRTDSRDVFAQGISALLSMSSIAALVTALVMAPPRSGPFCQEAECVTYPYTDAAEFVPNDYVWMYPAILMCLVFFTWVVMVLCGYVPGRSIAVKVTIGLAGMSVFTLLLAYGIQLLVMQPALVLGETESLSAWSQYNPHGLFIALESAGNWLAGLALIALSIAISAHGSSLCWIQRLSLVSGVVIIGLLPIMAAMYRTDLAYRFEVFSISILWPTLAILGLLGLRAAGHAPGEVQLTAS